MKNKLIWTLMALIICTASSNVAFSRTASSSGFSENTSATDGFGESSGWMQFNLGGTGNSATITGNGEWTDVKGKKIKFEIKKGQIVPSSKSAFCKCFNNPNSAQFAHHGKDCVKFCAAPKNNQTWDHAMRSQQGGQIEGSLVGIKCGECPETKNAATSTSGTNLTQVVHGFQSNVY